MKTTTTTKSKTSIIFNKYLFISFVVCSIDSIRFDLICFQSLADRSYYLCVFDCENFKFLKIDCLLGENFSIQFCHQS